MKLAEALITRADHNKRIEQLKYRLLRNAKVQEGEKPAEDPSSLMEELERLCRELETLIQRINRTNSAARFDEKMSLADALAARDLLTLKHGLYRELAQAATVVHDIRTKSEVKFKGTVKVSEIQERADQLAKAHRELDTKIQEMNWLTDLLA